MIKLKDIVGYPSLKYHLDNGLSLHEHVYRYNSDAFIQLFKEAREAHRNEEIELSEEDIELLIVCSGGKINSSINLCKKFI